MLKKSFTLIELLIIVAILGILTSILLPSLSKARLKAQRAVCISNCKQAGYALTMFLDENDELFPKNKPPHQNLWVDQITYSLQTSYNQYFANNLKSFLFDTRI